MEPSEIINLRWDGFVSNTKIAYRELRGRDDFSDLTLVGEDGKQVRAHQVIMAGGSSFFHKILRENPHPHPLIYLKDVKYDHLSSLLDFVYTGEAKIVKDHLNEFLDMAEDLNVKGLTLEKSDDQHPNPHSATSSSSNNDEDHNDTCDIKVEVGDDAHDNVYDGTNENSEQCISDVSLKVGDKTGDAVLSTEQEENGQPLSTEEQLEEEEIEPISKMDAMKADDGTDIMYKDEQSIHDWYERSEGNDMIIAHDEDNYNEVDSSYDMDGSEEVESPFVNEEIAHDSCDDSMSPDVEQDPLLPFEKEDFQHSFTSSELKRNTRSHAVEKSLQCLVCLKMFSSSSSLSQHKRLHTGEKPYYCPHCPKTFKHSSTLKKHKRVHTGEKPYQCPHCSKTFSYKSTLEQHQRVHTGEKPYQCSHCLKTFSHSGTLGQHQREVHTENPYQCPHCPKTCSRKRNLERHKKVHSGGE